MSDGLRRALAIASFAVGGLAALTYTGTIRWPDALVCALMGQAAFGPLCVSVAFLGWIALIGLIVGITLWWRAPGDTERP